MIPETIRVGAVWLLPETVRNIMVLANAVRVVSSNGVGNIGCDRPRFLFRDIVAGREVEFDEGARLGKEPFAYVLSGTETAAEKRYPVGGALIVPENLALPKGMLLLETPEAGDYHSFRSLQIVGITTRQTLMFGLAEKSYEVMLRGDRDPASLRAAVNKCIRDKKGHFTSVPEKEYLNYGSNSRLACMEIREVQHLPTTWGGLDLIADFRSAESRLEFARRKQEEKKHPGIDL